MAKVYRYRLLRGTHGERGKDGLKTFRGNPDGTGDVFESTKEYNNSDKFLRVDDDTPLSQTIRERALVITEKATAKRDKERAAAAKARNAPPPKRIEGATSKQREINKKKQEAEAQEETEATEDQVEQQEESEVVEQEEVVEEEETVEVVDPEDPGEEWEDEDEGEEEEIVI